MIEIHSLWEIALYSLSTGLILGHNLWLVAKENGDLNGETVRVELNTGHHFPVSESAVSPSRVADLRLVTANGSMPVTRYRVEDKSLVASAERNAMSAAIVALTLHPHPIVLQPEKFSSYIEDEDAHTAVAAGFQAGVTTQPQREIYTKYAKALLAGDNSNNNGSDEILRQVVNHKLEIIPQTNPVTLRIGERLSVQVLFDGKPVAGLRVSSGCEQLKSGTYTAHTRTGEDGRAAFEITATGRWYIRTHHIRPHPNSSIADWESFWSSLTWEINS